MAKHRQADDEQNVSEDEQEPTTKEPVYARTYYSGTGYVNIALYENHVPIRNGQTRLTYGTRLKRSFKTDSGYKDAKGFQEEDLPHILVAVTNALAWIDAQHRK